ncbi:hypothetical protein BKA65DRAFT_551566 [Rhexocercosporidium sp. MPI-PUGE-AT-0058]|nr:hypothetical protein BKA65DRAFT_551566 [Rhexocercosporidium sp. MPI-PUGE-AT-0058]
MPLRSMPLSPPLNNGGRADAAEVVALGTYPSSLIIRGAPITPWNYFPAIENEINATGKFVSPGFIDGNIHIECTKLVPGELGRLSVPRGTTTVLAMSLKGEEWISWVIISR